MTGTSWMDHEFGTSFLEPDQQGWDWFSLQLDDGAELMLYQMRRRDGRADPHSSGTLVDRRQARLARLRAADFTLAPSRALDVARQRRALPGGLARPRARARAVDLDGARGASTRRSCAPNARPASPTGRAPSR